ncbi:MAG: hypothetical protein A3G11_02060 [Candidatus Lloydbacteria bacterium RIFCSPLOWO2_12_FULL_51_9]|uniref:Ribosome-binding factor A n=2 Tax=Candidatus Lloydiibacteriota TaxID=1817910 RepID=A0A1G2DQD4_9BACT|nr:MAG: hypothetical protein A3J08_03405 [Candidatus Lloydbacteria bacterium RIFCSPLOWO2_02_FULL_51_11]OGZ15857.1 MAG: hypothetical protein A3G11_02060 [Candidatus Lloydbacteria bacterium RIFCSPLOWO2_12_FULL_51_9]
MTPRQEKLNVHVRTIIAEFLRKEFGTSPLVSVTELFVARGLQSARALITVFPAHEEERVCAVLKKRQGALRQYLALHTRMKYVPEVFFEIDRGEQNRQRIEELLKES